MIGAAFRVMALSLLRDRAALVMAFVLPTVIFSIFAAIFSGATGDRIRIHLGLADFARTAATQRLADALVADPSLRVTRLPATDLAEVIRAVRSGAVDV
ncbi:ABC transporter permease, partial [Methylobacterium sp. WL18]